MNETEQTAPGTSFGFLGLGSGAAALLLAIVHLWAGPFAAQPPAEESLADKAAAVRDAAVAVFKGDEAEAGEAEGERAAEAGWDADRVTKLVTAVLGGLAIVLGVVAVARHEALRPAGSAVVLGGTALALQYVVLALAVVFVALVLGAFLSNLS